ncbi:outer membrane protein [Paenirhodobacter populi]|uniref:Porin family protein n=1 Tax=Paenirhodobacter populi TaxID=2306993 RepID=A0A443JB62_9RHOB|nr:outer membrane beta-barrel protein [Sinirhodobacter populi]RWR17708.1 porin family protein [Sinirhodobacter populi]
MIKTFAIASVASMSAVAAMAGGYTAPVVEAAPVAPVVVPVYPTGWDGAYIGANINWGKSKVEAKDELADALGKKISEPDGTNGALRAGYDWQSGNGVYGLGAEYNFGKYKDSLTGNYAALSDGDVKIDKAGTLFARAGYAFNDNWLAYGLLGYTWADAKYDDGASQKKGVDGVTYGLGAEYKFNQNWSSYLEYAYTDLGSFDTSIGKAEADLQQIKLGVNYRF